MNIYLHPLSRLLVALIFIMSGVGKLFGFAATAEMMAGVGFPAPSLFLTAAILLELVGGTLLLVGFKGRWAALALVVFLVPATLIFHAANVTDPQHGQEQLIHVLKNLAILGALVKFMADGAGAYALDNPRAREGARRVRSGNNQQSGRNSRERDGTTGGGKVMERIRQMRTGAWGASR